MNCVLDAIIPGNIVSFAAARAGVTQRSPSPSGCFKPTYIPFPLFAIFLLGPISILLLYTLHQSQHSLASFRGKTLSGLRRVMEGTTKKIAESTKCYICSFISLSKNKVYIFEKTSADLAGIIRLSLEIDVNKYSEDSKLFVCRECFQQLTKYKRAAKKLLSTCRNREQLREKRLAREERSRDEQHWRCAS